MAGEAPQSIYLQFGKRLLDLLIVIPTLLAVLPILLITAVLIRLESEGPVFFIQDRMGKNGKTFRMLKFRSMTNKQRGYKKGGEISLDNPEVTRVGKVIRRLKIDEFPQLINILKGEMTIVGPRPAMPAQITEYDEVAKRRLEVTPGLTCLAQISGGIRLTWPERWIYDAEYVDKMSFALDLSIILRTFGVLIFGEEKFLKKPSAH